MLRDLRHEDGGFYSAEDADSEGVEGKFYLWSLDELTEVCGDAAPEVIRAYGVTAGGNFRDPHTGYSGNILHLVDRAEEPSTEITAALGRLFERRETRVRPGRDDKVLLGWNALFLRSLAEAAAALDRPDWMDAARANARFLQRSLRRDDGRWLRSWHASSGGRHLAVAEDYAALLEAFITLAEVDDVAWLDDARECADELFRLFHDDETGGFFTTGSDAEPLIVRPAGLLRQRDPVGELAGGRRAAPAGRDHRRRRRWRIRPAGSSPGWPRSPAATGPASGSCSGPTSGRSRRRSRSPWSATTRRSRHEVFARLIPASVAVQAEPGAGAEHDPAARGPGARRRPADRVRLRGLRLPPPRHHRRRPPRRDRRRPRPPLTRFGRAIASSWRRRVTAETSVGVRRVG